jgi:hypothetical protein
MNIRRLFIIAGMLALVSAAEAQERRTVGLGVKINPLALITSEDTQAPLLPLGLTSFSIPINVSRNFRVEPEFGLWSSSETVTSTFPPPATGDISSTYISAGAGVMYQQPIDDSFNAYGGIRGGIVASSQTLRQGSTTIDRSETDFFVGPCGGGEYLFSPHFSMGTELQINYIKFGEPETDATTTEPRNRSSIVTNAVIICRVYL